MTLDLVVATANLVCVDRGEVDAGAVLSATSTCQPLPDWWEFATSPGAGGAAALVAALLALLSVWLKNNYDRRENAASRTQVETLATKEREQADELATKARESAAAVARESRDAAADAARLDEITRRWWQLMSWTWDNREELGAGNAADVLAVLDEEAHTQGQKTIVTAALKALREEEDE